MCIRNTYALHKIRNGIILHALHGIWCSLLPEAGITLICGTFDCMAMEIVARSQMDNWAIYARSLIDKMDQAPFLYNRAPRLESKFRAAYLCHVKIYYIITHGWSGVDNCARLVSPHHSSLLPTTTLSCRQGTVD